jgi:hypothetical protein
MEIQQHLECEEGEKIFSSISYYPILRQAVIISNEPGDDFDDDNFIYERIFFSLESAVNNVGTYSVLSQLMDEVGDPHRKTVKIGSLVLSVINENPDDEDSEEYKAVIQFLTEYAIKRDFWAMFVEVKSRTGKWFE